MLVIVFSWGIHVCQDRFTTPPHIDGQPATCNRSHLSPHDLHDIDVDSYDQCLLACLHVLPNVSPPESCGSICESGHVCFCFVRKWTRVSWSCLATMGLSLTPARALSLPPLPPPPPVIVFVVRPQKAGGFSAFASGSQPSFGAAATAPAAAGGGFAGFASQGGGGGFGAAASSGGGFGGGGNTGGGFSGSSFRQMRG